MRVLKNRSEFRKKIVSVRVEPRSDFPDLIRVDRGPNLVAIPSLDHRAKGQVAN